MKARQRLEPLARTLGATTAVGLLLGLVVGGIGGRLAMRLLFVTSDERVRGMVSDDGFVIGQFSAATFNLLLVGALFGVAGTLGYLGVRPFLIGPLWLRTATCAVAAGVVVGGLVIVPNGVDFTELSPVPLAVALFVAIPALFATLAVPAMERTLQPGGWARSAPAPFALGPLAIFLFPPVLVVIGIPVALVLGIRWRVARSPRMTAVVHHAWSMHLARIAWAAIAVFGAFLLAEDVTALRSG